MRVKRDSDLSQSSGMILGLIYGVCIGVATHIISGFGCQSAYALECV